MNIAQLFEMLIDAANGQPMQESLYPAIREYAIEARYVDRFSLLHARFADGSVITIDPGEQGPALAKEPRP